jgi:glutamate synthase domain-containing protein 2
LSNSLDIGLFDCDQGAKPAKGGLLSLTKVTKRQLQLCQL